MKDKHKKCTILEVAERAGVSKATVGRVIGKYGIVSEEARERVMEAVRELEYTPNSVAQGLRRNNTKTLAVVVGSIRNNFCSQFVYAVEKEALKKGYNVLICNSQEDIQIEIQHLQKLVSRRVDGIILISAALGEGAIDKNYIHLYHTIPTILADRTVAGLDLDIVVSSNFKGSYDAAERLIKRGHTEIGVLASSDFSTIVERKKAYRKALEDNGIEFDITLEKSFAYAEEIDGEKVIKELLSQHPRLTALIIMNNSILAKIIQGMNKLKLKIGEDISMISWDDDVINNLMEIDTVLQPIEKMGKMATKRVFELIANEQEDFEQISSTLSTSYIERKSCKDIR